MLGVAPHFSNPDRHSCEFALTVGDAYQRHGSGQELMRRLMAVARDPQEPDVVQVRRHL